MLKSLRDKLIRLKRVNEKGYIYWQSDMVFGVLGFEDISMFLQTISVLDMQAAQKEQFYIEMISNNRYKLSAKACYNLLNFSNLDKLEKFELREYLELVIQKENLTNQILEIEYNMSEIAHRISIENKVFSSDVNDEEYLNSQYSNSKYEKLKQKRKTLIREYVEKGE